MDWKQYVRERLRLPGVNPAREAEIVDDLAQQLDEAYREALRRGASEADAHAAAQQHVPDWAAFANEMQAMEARRAENRGVAMDRRLEESAGGGGVPWWSDTVRDFTYAARGLRKSPGFALAVALTLALGIGSTTALFSLVNSILLAPLPFPQSEQVVLVWGTNHTRGQERDVIAGPNFADMQRQSRSFEALAAFHMTDLPARGDNGLSVIGEVRATTDFFAALGTRPLLGRAFEAGDGLPGRNHVALLGYGFWQNRFGGDPNIVGKTLATLGQPHTIIGVLPPDFRFFTKPEVVTPLVLSELEKQPRTNYHYWVVGRLKQGANAAQAEQELDEVMAGIAREVPQLRGWEVTVEGLRAVFHEPVRPALLFLLGAVGLVMLIACANVLHLLLVRGVNRQREFAVRVALGASPWRLMRQLLTESALLAALGGAAGVLLAYGLVAGIGSVLPQSVAVARSAALIALPDVGVDGWSLVFAVMLAAASVLLFGLWPAMRALRGSAPTSLASLSARGTGDARSGNARQLLISAEMALATVLLIASGLLLRTVVALLQTDSGFGPAGVRAMYVGNLDEKTAPQRVQFYQAVEREVAALPGVVSAGWSDYLPLQNEDDYKGFVREGFPLEPRYAHREEYRRVSMDYFRTVGLRAVSGRTFSEAEQFSAPSVAVVNQSMARKYWPEARPLGRRIYIPGKDLGWTEVIGVVNDTRENGLHVAAKPMIFVPYTREPRPLMALFVRASGEGARLQAAIRKAVEKVDPTQPVFSETTLPALLEESMSIHRLTMLAAGLLAGLSLVITAVGVFGVVSYTVALRARELGIRLALGATPQGVVRLVLLQGLARAAVGIAAGAAGAAALAGVLQSLLFGVSATDSATFAACCGFLLAMAALASYWPARRAGAVDPMMALRSE